MGKRLVERFCAMVRIDSESENEARFIEVTKSQLEDELGATCTIDDHGNLIAKVPAKGADGATPIFLAAHADTVKPGVGITFETAASPRVMDVLRIDAGVGFSLRWAEGGLPADPGRWDEIAAGRTGGGTLTLRLPDRRGGTWLLWLTELPTRQDGSWGAGIAEVRFRA